MIFSSQLMTLLCCCAALQTLAEGAEFFPMPAIVLLDSNCIVIRIGIELTSESFRLLRKETRLNSICISHGLISNQITYQMPPLTKRKNVSLNACENPFYDRKNSFFQTLN